MRKLNLLIAAAALAFVTACETTYPDFVLDPDGFEEAIREKPPAVVAFDEPRIQPLAIARTIETYRQ